MALKPHRKYNGPDTDISFFMNEVQERGKLVWMSTFGSGQALDMSVALVTATGSQSGKVPAGVLLNDMVDVDQSRYHLNTYKDEVQKGGKVTLLRRGEILTNMLNGTLTITPTTTMAYMGPSGLFTNVITTISATPPVGRFLSSPDEEGYAKIEINLPMIHNTSVS